MAGNGLRSHSFHVDRRQDVRASFRRAVPTPAAANAVSDADAGDVENTARDYLERAFASEELPDITNESVNGEHSTFELVTMDHSTITNSTIVRFTQRLSGVPIFGSAITVELDQDNELLAFSSALGEPHGVSPDPAVSPESAQETVRQYAQPPVGFELPEPVLIYYYETENEKWYLAFLLADVAGSSTAGVDVPLRADYVVNAHSGELIAVLARMCAANGVDALNRQRQFETSFDVVTSGQELRNATLNIITRDFRFQDIGVSTANLPGQNLVVPPPPWNPAAVSAHANTEIVARVFLDVLNRRGPDGRGGPFVSSINCVCVQLGSHGQEWLNSFWINHQVVHGQRQSGGQFRSFAAALDMVAHEFFHGVTEVNPGLIYQNETGALSESYSDIFGVLVGNGLNPNWSPWRWQIGSDTGRPLRDMSNPTSLNQPDHMNGFRRFPPNEDFGGVHVNSGIHNKAAFNIMMARDAQNRFLFSPRFIAQLFYSSLAHLRPTSLFLDSRRAVELTANTMLRIDPQKEVRLGAISQGFTAVGIG
jgi:Zn-dependent metalloprotease